jgi:peptidoglycan/xylan/chitin deacetylase (PgdA/CDA1 family)
MAAAGATGARAALDGDQITELKPYVDFQSHTVTHPILPRCDDDKALRELADSRLDLQRRYGLRVYAVAYPNGDWSQRDLRFARQAGYRCGLTVRSGFNGPRTDPFRMRRIAVNDDMDGVHVVVLKACGVWGALRSVSPRRRGRGSPQERV